MSRSFSAVLLLATACTADADSTAARSEAIQMDRSYFRVALDEPGPLGVALAATGTVFVPVRDASGALVTQTVGSEIVPIRMTCGVTFVSRRHAITAAHCVPSQHVPNPNITWLEVRTYDLSPQTSWDGTAADLSGSWPAFTHDPIAPYDVDTHYCRVLMRCGDKWGAHDCTMPQADVALLDCPDLPGCQSGTTDVATSETSGMTVELPWSHEVYDIPPFDPTLDPPPGTVPLNWDLETHYTAWAESSWAQNFHYFGGTRNQPLPLLAKPFAGGASVYRTGPLELVPDMLGVLHEVRWTNLGGCHGTSGSGVVTLDASANSYRLLGPMSVATLPNRLCHANHQVTPSGSTFAYSPRSYTAAVVAAGVTCQSHCPGEPENVYLWNECSSSNVAEYTEHPGLKEGWWPPPPGSSLPPWERWRVMPEPTLRLDPDATFTLPQDGYAADRTYRISVRVVAAGATALLDASIGGDAVFTRQRPVWSPSERAGVITATFRSRAAGPRSLVLHADRTSSTLRITEIVVIPERTTLGFERHDQRVGVGLATTSAAIGPARFTGDGRGGRAASMRGGERLLFTRLALGPGRTWSLSFTTDRDARLTCGALLSDGTDRRTPCNAVRGAASARLVLPAGLVPLGFFVDAEPSVVSLRVDDLRIE